MQKRSFLSVILIVVCMILSSCSGLNLITEDLMRPPRLTQEQIDLEDALRESLSTGEYSLKYPKGGDYRSAFVFHDLDGDGEEEVLAFYSLQYDEYARVAILDFIDEKWVSVCELSGEDINIEFVSFAHVTSQDTPNILIGWSGSRRGESQLAIYTYEDRTLNNLLKYESFTEYSVCWIDDLNLDGMDDVILLIKDSGTREESSWIRQITFDRYNAVYIEEYSLSDSIADFSSVTTGQFSPDSQQRALFIDEQIAGNMLVTEVFTLESGSLEPVIYSGMDEPEYEQTLEEASALTAEEAFFDEDYEEWLQLSLFDRTLRPQSAAYCADVNDDGVIEIPTARIMPGYDSDAVYEVDRLYLTEYQQLQGEHYQRITAVVFNSSAQSGGYSVRFPLEWIGNVTIVNVMEEGEWRFIAYDNTLEDPLSNLSGELARIRVVSQQDYQDQFLASYQELARRGTFIYYGYIPPNVQSPYAITIEELKQMVALV